MTGSIILPDDISAVMPGDSLIITIKLVDKVPAQIGDTFCNA